MRKAQGDRGWAAVMLAASVMMLVAPIASPAQTFTTLVNFSGTDGNYPAYGLVEAIDGNLYGTTNSGGATGQGTLFSMTGAAVLRLLLSFDYTDGQGPQGLIQIRGGAFYGMSQGGGANGYGTVFRIAAQAQLTTLHSFDSADGAQPTGWLVETSDGDLYGTTAGGGGSISCAGGCGTVFKIAPSGTLITLHTFERTDGFDPLAGLVLASNGKLYGTTAGGGANDGGTIFSITPAGVLTTLYNFSGNDGSEPLGGLVQAKEGDLYGTTEYGGTNDVGTVFKITPNGTLTTLHSFNSTDGAYPSAGLLQGTDGNFYGTTYQGGANVYYGTVFEMTPTGNLKTLHSFDSTHGELPLSSLTQATDGSFYGTTSNGGSGGKGTVFNIAVGLGQFVKTLPTFGAARDSVTILGTNLIGATNVTFNGTTANFTASKSGTYISTTVPTGATTGPVQVVTPRGTLTSNVSFQVLP